MVAAEDEDEGPKFAAAIDPALSSEIDQYEVPGFQAELRRTKLEFERIQAEVAENKELQERPGRWPPVRCRPRIAGGGGGGGRTAPRLGARRRAVDWQAGGDGQGQGQGPGQAGGRSPAPQQGSG